MNTGEAENKGRLYVVATPIGNLEDITLRALNTLRQIDLIVAEDTRRTRQLCNRFGITTRLRPLHAHSNPQTVELCVREMLEGARLALVSDAGTPLVSDPGAALVQAALRLSIKVEAIPGPSAITAALSIAGINFDHFRFVGFLPRGGSRRSRLIQEIADDRSAIVLFESPNRVGRTLAELAEYLKNRPVAVCRELTKLHEEVVRGSAAELAERFGQSTRGEITLIIEGRSEEKESEPVDVDLMIGAALDRGMRALDIAKKLAKETNLSRGELYAQIVAAKKVRGE